ncbi:MAG: SLC13 family permease [Pseudomonadota bacterium]
MLNLSPETICLALMVLMVTLWILEVIPLGITALLPIVVLPIAGVLPLKEVTQQYGNPMIFLFLGGFVIARALEKTQLNERLALSILRRTGHSASGVLIGFILGTAFLSMWISNTATTLMMVPIALSVLSFFSSHLKSQSKKDLDLFSVSLFLCIAYSANIGGVITPIGTPPNVVFLGYLEELYQRQIDFFLWMATVAPIGVTLLFAMYVIVTKLYPVQLAIPSDFGSYIQKKLDSQSLLASEQRVTLCIFFLTAFLWIFKGLIHKLLGFSALNDTSIAILGALLLFLVPTGKGKRTLVKADIAFLPWDIVLLFGGGMALAKALAEVGLIEKLVEISSQWHNLSPFLLIAFLVTMVLLLTEIMSNVALCVVALPLLMKVAESQGLDPLLVGIPAVLASSFAFAFPVSTPPNAIVFGTEKITMKQMLRAGLLVNVIALAITLLLSGFLIRTILL